MAVGLGTAAFIVGADHLKVSLPSFLRAGRELAKFSFSLYAIHYPIPLLLNVTVASDRQEFTLDSVAGLTQVSSWPACSQRQSSISCLKGAPQRSVTG